MTPLQLPTSFRAFTSSSVLALVGLLNKAVPLKTRYILTNNNRLRLRYVAAGVSMLVLFGLVNGSNLIHSDSAAEEVASVEPASGVMQGLNIFRDGAGQIRRQSDAIESAALVQEDSKPEKTAVKQTGPVDVSVEVGRGDTFASVLQDAGVEAEEARNVVNQISHHFNMKKLRAGQKLDLRLEPDGENLALSKVSFTIDPLKTLHIERDNEGDLNTRLDEKKVLPTRRAAKVVIDGSLYGSAEKANLPDTITANTIKMFSYAVDFQRDIRPGDKLEVLYDTYETSEGYVAKVGDIVHARMVIGGKEFSLYRYKNKDGSADFYTQDGKSIRKSGSGLMRTPIAFGRMTSGFGMREHPILGYTKMHKGVDFAAPVGTPIFAAADGTIEKAGIFSSFGNYVRIRHNSKMSTAYGHVSRFASGVRPGARVKQGQTIAYVGTTGRSTGPHLHFEVLINNVQVNPRSVKLVADDRSLKGEDLRRFKAMVRGMDQEYVRRSNATRLASARGPNLGSVE